jgi:hypothetical protein
MEIVERILAKLVGHEIPTEEMEQVAGGLMAEERCPGGWVSYSEPGRYQCDV